MNRMKMNQKKKKKSIQVLFITRHNAKFNRFHWLTNHTGLNSKIIIYFIIRDVWSRFSLLFANTFHLNEIQNALSNVKETKGSLTYTIQMNLFDDFSITICFEQLLSIEIG